MADESKQPEKMADAWDRMSSDYIAETELAPTEHFYLELAERIPPTEEKLNVLDLGSGLGFALDGILPNLPHAKFTCIDVSSEMLEKLTKRLSQYAAQIKTQQGSYVAVELGEAKFEYILSAFTVHHLPKEAKLKLFQKIFRALKKGGSYVELDGVASPAQEREMFEDFKKNIAHREGAECGDWNHDLLLTIENETKLLEEAGFTSVSTPWKETDDEGRGRAVFVALK